ncbi:hypothetical protein Gorai_018292, partial [Gossypium raimondii]|nr:hypothetical protein [Gossypium raimondii]
QLRRFDLRNTCFLLGAQEWEIDPWGRGAIGNGELTATSEGMGVIRSAFSLMAGTLFGVYLAQNYNVPNIGKLLNSGLVIAQHIEENYRKPSATTNSNDDAVDVSK